jgi:glyoxylase-like metal-dependent hydrolase (beta-lactamase superfamily II)
MLGLTLALLAVVVVVGRRRPVATEHDASAALRPAVLGPAPVEVVPGVYLLGGLAPAAAYVVRTSAGLVLIDSGLDPDARSLKRQMTWLGLEWKSVCAILLTHVHADHTGGAQHLRAATGAKVYAGWDDSACLRAGGPREAFFSAFPFPPEVVPSRTTVDVELKGDQTIVIGDVHFEALDMPGHTPGSIGYWMDRNHLRVLFSGDVILSLVGNDKAYSRLAKPLGTYLAYLAPRYRGDAKAFLASLRKLRALPAPDLVLPGHPRMDPEPPSPTLSQERWEAILDDGIRDMETLLARQASDGANFLDGTPRQLLPDLYYLGEFKGAAVYGCFAASNFFLVNAPGGPGLMDHVKTRLEQLGVKPAEPTAVLLTACGPEETAGLNDLMADSHAQVVAAPAGLDRVKELVVPGARLLSTAELPQRGWFSVDPVTLRGRGLAPVAYQVHWANKCVLFSGRIPIKSNPTAASELLKDFSQGRGSRIDYAASLEELSRLTPDLWLPAVPVDAQGANLYDRDWQDILEYNRQLLR